MSETTTAAGTTTLSVAKKSFTAAKIIKLAAIPVALLASAGIVGQASYSAYTATTSNPTSNWTSGTVALTDDDGGSSSRGGGTPGVALFTVANLKPGSTGTNCIVVSSSGSLASTVKLYGTGYSTTNALASSINLKIEQGSGGSFGSCANFTAATSNGTLYNDTLAAFGTGSAAKTNFATGLGDWAPTGTATETKTYRFTYTLSSGATNDTQGGTAAIGFTWEAQNS